MTKQNENKSSEVIEYFDPAALGFDVVLEEYNFVNRAHVNDDYLVINNSKKTSKNILLSLCGDTAEKARALFGDRCGVALKSENGQIVIFNGRERGISKMGGGVRSYIALNAAKQLITDLFGDVSRVYLTPSIWAKGNAIILTPTGEVE